MPGFERLETPVVVVGGGVSGCACAVALAATGVGVTLVDPALDRLGEPSFGPIVVEDQAGRSDGMSWLEDLPEPLRGPWAKAALSSGDGRVVIVDRRLVGLRTKYSLEQTDGVRLRQGLVVEVSCSDPGLGQGETCQAGPEREMVRAKTAFGEILAADVVVIAVGSGLGESGEGGWLPPCAGLRESLAALGAEFAATCVEVGPSFGGDVGAGQHQEICVERLTSRHEGWGEGSPESPYEREELWPRWVRMEKDAVTGEVVVVAPDGLATGEVAMKAGRIVTEETASLMSRPGNMRHGLAITNVDQGGRMEVPGKALAVWVTGRAAGSETYVESLAAGLRTAEAVAKALGSAGSLDGEGSGS